MCVFDAIKNICSDIALYFYQCSLLVFDTIAGVTRLIVCKLVPGCAKTRFTQTVDATDPPLR